MIILRYLTREVLMTTFAVTSILLVIIMSGRFVKYLAEAAAGKMDANVLFAVMFYRLPGFLELILPLGFFVALLLAYGRLYTDQEMTVLFACGVSRKKLITWTYVPASFIAVVISLFSLWLSPLSLQKAEEILAQQQTRNDFDTMQEARFQLVGNGDFISYTEEISGNREQLRAFFLANVGVSADEPLMIVRAESAERMKDENVNERYLLLNNGIRYEGRPGQADYRVTEFEQLAQRIESPVEIVVTRNKVNRLRTVELMNSDLPDHRAALQWRVSLPLLVLIIALLGVIFSHTTPRRGRYVMLLPSVLFYLIYLVLLNAARSAVEEERLPVEVGLWGIHFLFMVLVLFLCLDKSQWLRFFMTNKRRPNR
ncbi:LPS export ABC transporter permease LptF [Candidatus Endobugula sertula]|uniref:Lipopolysaccharide export system permease protein LptF n=1 Tax=Candidatus Endobugula sertula TaxID=62101 RepID=A0A1D2QQQ9_9GAMM|nr:LPS export ABC transporter permease LptF [Candidatus Endobugula sertula]